MTSIRIGLRRDPAELSPLRESKNHFGKLPRELREHGQFVLYRNEQDRKVPYCPSNPARRARSNEPKDWASWAETKKAFDTYPFAGINAVCAPPFVFVDIDDCIDEDGKRSEDAKAVMADLPPTYWEVSPSGTGLHAIYRLKGKFRNIPKAEGGRLEAYGEKHFMSVTGWHCPGTSTKIGTVTAKQLEQFRTKPARTAQPSGTNGKAENIPAGSRTNTLLSLAGAMRHRGVSLDEIERTLRQHNLEHCSPPLEDKKIHSILKSVDKYKAASNLLLQENKDVGNGDRLLLWGEGNFRYIAAFKRWAVYDGIRWPVEDREQETVRIGAHAMVRAFAKQAVDAGEEKTIKFAADCLNSPRVTNLLREAQPKATLPVADLDRDPLLINFRNGTLDANTGKLRAHRREDYITAVIPHDYKSKAQCPKWNQFVSDTFKGDREMVEFVQCALGYSLTGDTSEKCIFLAHGPKDTGKTTLLNVVMKLMGDYAGRIKVESLMVERGRPIDANAQSDLADLRGKRFEMTSETGQGQRLREELVKLLSQGQSTYRAVRKYENPFDFPETWKIWIDCNHLPVVHGTDDAIWERLTIIPFQHIVPKAKQNRKLGDELIAAEAEGILAWLVQGLHMWRTDGLLLPASMLAVRKQWRKESDDIGQWLEEKCVVRSDANVSSEVLYQSYATWRGTNRLYPESMVLFARKMKEHGFAKKEVGDKKVPTWYGVGIVVVDK